MSMVILKLNTANPEVVGSKRESGKFSRLQRRETAAVDRDVMADDLGIEVIEGGEDPHSPVLERLHHAGVGAPEHIRRLGQDGAVMVIRRAGRTTIGR